MQAWKWMNTTTMSSRSARCIFLALRFLSIWKARTSKPIVNTHDNRQQEAIFRYIARAAAARDDNETFLSWKLSCLCLFIIRSCRDGMWFCASIRLTEWRRAISALSDRIVSLSSPANESLRVSCDVTTCIRRDLRKYKFSADSCERDDHQKG